MSALSNLNTRANLNTQANLNTRASFNNRADSFRTPGLTLLESVRSLPRARTNPRLFLAMAVVTGLVAIAIGNLLLSIATSEGVYQVAGLKAEQQRLALNTQILGQQVSSLSSDQNLSNAAQVLGMVSNANPVFLDVNNQVVQGKPMAALSNTTARVSGNLVANSVMTTKTTAKALRAAVAAQEAKATSSVLGAPVKIAAPSVGNHSTWTGSTAASGYVGGSKSATSQVGLAGGGIPASPTH